MSSRDITFKIMHHALFVINKEYFQQDTTKNYVKPFLEEPFLLLSICIQSHYGEVPSEVSLMEQDTIENVS